MIYRVVLDDTIDLHTSDINCMLLNPSLDLEMNSAGSFNFTLPPSHPYWDAIKVLKSTIDVYEDGDLIFTGRIASIEKNWNNERVVQCEGALAYFNDSIHRQMKWETPLPIASEDPTVHNFLKDILDNHNVFEGAENANRHIFIGNITVDPEVVTREVNYDTTLDILTRMCIDTNGGYMSVRKDLDDGKLYLDWIKDFTEESGQPAQFGLNLLNFDTSLAAEDICTGVLARGAEVNEQTVMLNDVELVDETTYPDMSVTHYTDKYQDILWHREGVAKFGQVVQVHDFSDAQTAWKDGQGQIVANSLFEMAKKWLEEKNTKIETIEVEVAELAWLGEGMPKYKLGQIVELSDNVHMAGESYETRLLPMYKLSCDLNSGSKKVTLGTPPKKELTQISASNSDSSTLSSSGSSSGSGGGSGEGEECRVHDVRVDGTSVVTNKIANISLTGKADVSTVNALATTVAGKADTSTVNALATTVASKQNQIEFNTLEAATEVLTRLKADNKVYNLGGGTEVEANPSEAATDDLNTIKIGETVYDIPGGGSTTNYGKFKCDLLFVNDPLPHPTQSGTANVTRNYTLSKSIDDYDAVYVIVYGYYYDSGSTVDGPNQKLSGMIFKSDYYSDNNWLFNSSALSRNQRLFLRFTDDTHVETITTRSDAYDERVLYKVYGLKFENKLINRSDIYSEEERMIGRWTDGKPLYQKTIIYQTPINIANGSWYTSTETYSGINIVYSDIINSSFAHYTGAIVVIENNKLVIGNQTHNQPMSNIKYITIRYTKTTDTPDSGVIPEDPMFISDPMIFSEEEQVVGSWTDGKPLYQKTFLNIAVQSGTSNVFTHNLGIDKYIDFSGRCCVNGDGWSNAKPLPYYQINWGGYVDILAWDANSIAFNSKWNSSYVDITIQYTKVADSPLSGPKKGKIVQRSDIYSEEERLVGRWTDGKPLYQKTLFNVSNGDVMMTNVDTFVDIIIKRHGYGSNSDYIDIGDGYQTNDFVSPRLTNGVLYYEDWSSTQGGITKVADAVTIKYTKTTDLPFSKQLIEDPQFVMMSDIYSEEEQVVGRWTDGKPLYQKTIKINSSEITIGTWNLYSAYGTNSGNIIKFISGHLYRVINNNEYVDWFNNWTQNNDNTCMVSQRPSGIEFKVNNDMSSGLQYVAFTIQYTKTTDVPGTGPTKGNLIYLPALYSEEEREVGVWKDGKPIYQKNIPIPTIQSAQSGVLISNLGLNIDNCVDIKVRLYKDTAPDNDSVIATASFGDMYFYYRKSEDSIRMDAPFSWVVGRYGNITIQYTKTTDQPGSGTWTPEGQLAHNYSTSEKIVGTWIDGSTIYERTIVIDNPVSTGATTSIAHGIADVESIVDIYGGAYLGSTCIDLNSFGSSNYYTLIYASQTNISYELKWGSSTFTKICATLQYTKTS